MSGNEGELSPATNIELLLKQAKSQSIFAWTMILLTLLMLMAVLVSNAFLFQKVKPLLKQTPEYRLKLAYVAIKQGHGELEENLKPYHALFQREDIQKLFAISKQNENLPVESEEDLISLIEDYRSALFNLASNIPGSGEWHRYHREQLRDFIENAKLRADTLKMMVAQKPQ